MISWINGKVKINNSNSILITTQGVGYKVILSKSKLKNYSVDQEVQFFLLPILKNNGFEFYGFKDFEEKQIFELLLHVNGLGPKAAQKILNVYDWQEIVTAIQNKDLAFFENISGIGKKVSSKIFIDLEKKILKLNLRSEKYSSASSFDSSLKQNLISALKNFGYKEDDILNVLSELQIKDNTFQSLFKICLNKINSKKYGKLK